MQYLLPTVYFMCLQLFFLVQPLRAEGFVVLELFTSQGCSSCPPADALLREVKEMADTKNLKVYPLSYHVHYWNYLGWKDPYTLKQAAPRQRRYTRKLGSTTYTPQLIINGSRQVLGSDREVVLRSIEELRKDTSKTDLTLQARKLADEEVQLNYTVKPFSPGLVLQIAVTEKIRSNFVPRGENTGRNLKHSEVVRSLRSIPLEQKSMGEGVVLLKGVNAPERLNITAFIQESESLQIIAADKISADL